MRVGLVIYGGLETVSGGCLYDRKLVEYLQSRGDSVQLIGLPPRNYLSHLADNLHPSLRRRLAGLQVDLLIQDELNHPSLCLLNRWLHTQVEYPLLTIVHHLRSSEPHPSLLTGLYRRLERSYLSGMDGFIYNSQATRRSVEALVGNHKPWLVAYPAGDRLHPQVSEPDLLRRAKQPGPLELLFLGNLIRRKGLHILVDALGHLPRGRFHLSVIGNPQVDPPYAHQVHTQVANLGLGRWVDFYGLVSDGELAERMRRSHLMVVQSTYEGFGIAYLEGMGFGLPSIATLAGGAAELVLHGQNGFLLQPDDAGGLACLLAKLEQDRHRLAQLSLAARASFLAHPRWDETGERIRAFLESQRKG